MYVSVNICGFFLLRLLTKSMPCAERETGLVKKNKICCKRLAFIIHLYFYSEDQGLDSRMFYERVYLTR